MCSQYRATLTTVQVLALVLAAMLLTSCPVPIDLDMVTQIHDSISPTIEITTPADGSPYAKDVLITGVVTDCCDEYGEPGGVVSLTYSILATDDGGSIAVAADGRFSTSFSTTTYNNDIVVQLVAIDWNGNSFETSIRLINAGNDIPSFTAVPGNGEVTLTWDDVPLAESYTIYDTTWDTQWDDELSPFVCSDLPNGELHSFRLKATTAGGGENWSDELLTFPLSPRTLAPTATASYGRIVVEWLDIPGCSEYAVLRSEEPGGPYTINAFTQDNVFLDQSVAPFTDYYYRIQPSAINTLESDYASARTAVFGSPKIAGTASVISGSVAVRGGYAYTVDPDIGLVIIDVSDSAHPVVVGEGSWGLIQDPEFDAKVARWGGLPFWPSWGIAAAEFGGKTFAFVAVNLFGLAIFDVSDPTQPDFSFFYPIGDPRARTSGPNMTTWSPWWTSANRCRRQL